MRCARCGADEPDVIVCAHRLAGDSSAHTQPPRGEARGWQLCAACLEAVISDEELIILCTACAESLDMLKRLR